MITSQLKAALEKSHLPIREVAALSGISAATLFKFRKDPDTSMTFANVEALARALGLQLALVPADQTPVATPETKEQSTSIGFINRNNQQVISSHLGTLNDTPIRLYTLRCNDCQGPEYEAHSYVIWQRKCPHCQQ